MPQTEHRQSEPRQTVTSALLSDPPLPLLAPRGEDRGMWVVSRKHPIRRTSHRLARSSVGNPANEMTLVGMERDVSPADLRAMCRGIGAELRTLHSDALREETPDRIAELLRQLDQQQRQLDQKDRKSTYRSYSSSLRA
jgi:hypothetical protein